jgi:hypothetical protein
MTLIPVMSQTAVLRGAPSDKTATNMSATMPTRLYTCPMAQHADVVSDKPGKCPKCDMRMVETSSVSHGPAAEQHWKQQHPATP